MAKLKPIQPNVCIQTWCTYTHTFNNLGFPQTYLLAYTRTKTGCCRHSRNSEKSTPCVELGAMHTTTAWGLLSSRMELALQGAEGMAREWGTLSQAISLMTSNSSMWQYDLQVQLKPATLSPQSNWFLHAAAIVMDFLSAYTTLNFSSINAGA